MKLVSVDSVDRPTYWGYTDKVIELKCNWDGKQICQFIRNNSINREIKACYRKTNSNTLSGDDEKLRLPERKVHEIIGVYRVASLRSDRYSLCDWHLRPQMHFNLLWVHLKISLIVCVTDIYSGRRHLKGRNLKWIAPNSQIHACGWFTCGSCLLSGRFSFVWIWICCGLKRNAEQRMQQRINAVRPDVLPMLGALQNHSKVVHCP